MLESGVVEASADAGPVKVLVELADPPAAVVYGEVLRSSPLAGVGGVTEIPTVSEVGLLALMLLLAAASVQLLRKRTA